MMILAKNMSHNSDIYVLKGFCGTGTSDDSYYKSSSTPYGISVLKNELAGYQWYSKHSNNSYLPIIEFESEQYLKVQYPFIQGLDPVVMNEYLSNTRLVEEAIGHYVEIWSNYIGADIVPVHGDLSLEGNILFTENGPMIIDWEHFSEEGLPIGFDALYLLFVSLYFHSLYRKITTKELGHVKKMVIYLQDNKCLSDVYSSGYLKKMLEILELNDRIWGKQKGKIPLNRFSKEDMEFIDTYLSS
jgi:hypothetical protein